MAAPVQTSKLGTYEVLSKLHHDKTIHRAGERIQLSDAHAAPLLQRNIVKEVK